MNLRKHLNIWNVIWHSISWKYVIFETSEWRYKSIVGHQINVNLWHYFPYPGERIQTLILLRTECWRFPWIWSRPRWWWRASCLRWCRSRRGAPWSGPPSSPPPSWGGPIRDEHWGHVTSHPPITAHLLMVAAAASASVKLTAVTVVWK